MIEETYKLFEKQSVDEYYDSKYERKSMCPPQTTTRNHRQLHKIHAMAGAKRCRVSQIVADDFAVNISSIPTDRTQTPEEALELSIWSPHNTFNMSLLRFCAKSSHICILVIFSETELDEAFCRDIESFSPAYTPRVRSPW